ncbi:hypothetical protein R0J93_29365, partial [Pseudoalteromonas sp. SIMBA_148]
KTFIDSIEKVLFEFFHSNGKYNAKVDITITKLPRNRVKLKTDLDEGDAASIRKINLMGNELFSNEKLLKQYESQQD